MCSATTTCLLRSDTRHAAPAACGRSEHTADACAVDEPDLLAMPATALQDPPFLAAVFRWTFVAERVALSRRRPCPESCLHRHGDDARRARAVSPPSISADLALRRAAAGQRPNMTFGALLHRWGKLLPLIVTCVPAFGRPVARASRFALGRRSCRRAPRSEKTHAAPARSSSRGAPIAATSPSLRERDARARPAFAGRLCCRPARCLAVQSWRPERANLVDRPPPDSSRGSTDQRLAAVARQRHAGAEVSRARFRHPPSSFRLAASRSSPSARTATPRRALRCRPARRPAPWRRRPRAPRSCRSDRLPSSRRCRSACRPAVHAEPERVNIHAAPS